MPTSPLPTPLARLLKWIECLGRFGELQLHRWTPVGGSPRLFKKFLFMQLWLPGNGTTVFELKFYLRQFWISLLDVTFRCHFRTALFNVSFGRHLMSPLDCVYGKAFWGLASWGACQTDNWQTSYPILPIHKKPKPVIITAFEPY